MVGYGVGVGVGVGVGLLSEYQRPSRLLGIAKAAVLLLILAYPHSVRLGNDNEMNILITETKAEDKII